MDDSLDDVGLVDGGAAVTTSSARDRPKLVPIGRHVSSQITRSAPFLASAQGSSSTSTSRIPTPTPKASSSKASSISLQPKNKMPRLVATPTADYDEAFTDDEDLFVMRNNHAHVPPHEIWLAESASTAPMSLRGSDDEPATLSSSGGNSNRSDDSNPDMAAIGDALQVPPLVEINDERSTIAPPQPVNLDDSIDYIVTTEQPRSPSMVVDRDAQMAVDEAIARQMQEEFDNEVDPDYYPVHATADRARVLSAYRRNSPFSVNASSRRRVAAAARMHGERSFVDSDDDDSSEPSRALRRMHSPTERRCTHHDVHRSSSPNHPIFSSHLHRAGHRRRQSPFHAVTTQRNSSSDDGELNNVAYLNQLSLRAIEQSHARHPRIGRGTRPVTLRSAIGEAVPPTAPPLPTRRHTRRPSFERYRPPTPPRPLTRPTEREQPNHRLRLLRMDGMADDDAIHRAQLLLEQIHGDMANFEHLLELDSLFGNVTRRLTDEQVQRLPTMQYVDEDVSPLTEEATSSSAPPPSSNKSACAVCMCDFETGECLRMLPCSHKYHNACIDQWFKQSCTCPVCRDNVLTHFEEADGKKNSPKLTTGGSITNTRRQNVVGNLRRRIARVRHAEPSSSSSLPSGSVEPPLAMNVREGLHASMRAGVLRARRPSWLSYEHPPAHRRTSPPRTRTSARAREAEEALMGQDPM